MKILIAGGNKSLKLFDDLKVRVAFNRFNGDGVVKTIFPNINTNAEGNYEAVYDASVSSGDTSLIKSVTAESEKLNYVFYALAGIIAVVIVWMFAKR